MQKVRLVFNAVEGGTEAVSRYYKEESFYAVHHGTGSGGTTAEDIRRYHNSKQVLLPHISSKDAEIVDIGCGQGGFLASLRDEGYSNLTGVDASHGCIPIIEKKGITGIYGTLDAIPLPDNQIDVVTLSHVLEHQYSLISAMNEIRRVLKPGGLLYIEVPNAIAYDTTANQEVFWLGLKEHINHFTKGHLEYLLHQNGFSIITVGMTSVTIPALYIIARSENKYSVEVPSYCCIQAGKDAVIHYYSIKRLQFKQLKAWIDVIMTNSRYIYFWGLSFNILTLSKELGLSTYNNIFFVDKNTSLHKLTIFGQSIHDLTVLNNASSQDSIVLTASSHRVSMMRYINEHAIAGTVYPLGGFDFFI